MDWRSVQGVPLLAPKECWDSRQQIPVTLFWTKTGMDGWMDGWVDGWMVWYQIKPLNFFLSPSMGTVWQMKEERVWSMMTISQKDTMMESVGKFLLPKCWWPSSTCGTIYFLCSIFLLICVVVVGVIALYWCRLSVIQIMVTLKGLNQDNQTSLFSKMFHLPSRRLCQFKLVW